MPYGDDPLPRRALGLACFLWGAVAGAAVVSIAHAL